jgi:nucleoside-diphosphate-sugar epimerase
MSSRILVTGATGFIGRHLVRGLTAAGNRLIVVVRESSQVEMCEFDTDVQVVVHGGKPGIFQEAMGQHSVCGVIHLASEYVKDDNPASISSLVESNISFGAQVADAASRAGARWFLNVGTTWQHFRGQEGDAANFYAATKNSFEQILNYYQASRDLVSVNVYLSDTYGPGDRRGKILNTWRDAALDGRVVKMSPGQQKLNLLHVDDVCSALLLLVERFDRGLASAVGASGFSWDQRTGFS